MTTIFASRSARLIAAAALSGLWFTSPVGGTRADPGRTLTVCGTPVAALERDYTVFARVRPFLIWIGHTQVGDARLEISGLLSPTELSSLSSTMPVGDGSIVAGELVKQNFEIWKQMQDTFFKTGRPAARNKSDEPE